MITLITSMVAMKIIAIEFHHLLAAAALYKTIKPIEIYQLGFALIILSVFIGLYICSQTTCLLIPLGFIGVTAAAT